MLKFEIYQPTIMRLRRIGLILTLVISFGFYLDFTIQNFELLEIKLRSLNKPIPEQKPGDWLSENPEPGQTFQQFVNTTKKPIDFSNESIYIKTIGSFDSLEYALLNETKDYLQAFFQCNVIIEEVYAMKDIPRKAKRKRKGRLQLNTDYINYRLLYPNRPENAIAYLAITKEDLYQCRECNFVFGQADQLNKVGVASFARYDYPDSTHFKKTLKRLIKTTSHEIAHMFHLEHCISAKCLMNGSNNLEESDSQPLSLCSESLVKLAWFTQIDLMKRDRALLSFFEKYEMNSEFNYVNRRMDLTKVFFEQL